jgi:hypothetical protein
LPACLSFADFSVQGNDAGSTLLFVIFLVLMVSGACAVFLLRQVYTI